MSKHIGAYSSLHGPGGKTLTDYTESNIPALWNLTIERITSVANTGAQYTGHIPGWTEANPFTYTDDKFFLFTPHVDSLENPTLSLNGLALLPILEPATYAPLAPGALSPAGNYLLYLRGGAFERIMDLRDPSAAFGDSNIRVVYDPATTTTTIYGGNPPTIPLFIMRSQDGYTTFGSPTRFDAENPVFKNSSNARGGTTTTSLIITDTDDPGDFGQRTAFLRTKSHFGQRITNSWHQQYGPDSTGLDFTSYDISRRTIKPINLSGGPTFTADYDTNATGYTTNKKYHFFFEDPSGATPTINLNGWGAKPLKRASGSTPSTNFWPARTEVTFLYNGSEMRADASSNSDRSEGREDNRAGIPPFNSRTSLEASLLVAEPGLVNRGTAARTIHITRHGEAVERPVRWDNPLGFTVFGGWGSYESGVDQFGEYNNFAYPFQLTAPTIGGELINEHGGDRWLTQYAPGPENPLTTFGLGQATIIAPDLGRGVEALYIGKAGEMDTGLSIAFDNTTQLFELRAMKRGSVPIPILSGDNGGEGRLDSAGWMRIQTDGPHGLKEIDLVHIIGTTGNAADGIWTTKRVSDIRFLLCGCRANTMAAGGTATKVTRTTLLTFNPANSQIRMALPTSSAGLPANTLWNDAGTVKVT